MNQDADAILDHVLDLLFKYGGRRFPDGADRLVGTQHGVTGWDNIDLLEEIEKAYGVDLAPFVEGRAILKKGWFRTYRVPGDATARELANHIAALLRSKPEQA